MLIIWQVICKREIGRIHSGGCSETVIKFVLWRSKSQNRNCNVTYLSPVDPFASWSEGIKCVIGQLSDDDERTNERRKLQLNSRKIIDAENVKLARTKTFGTCLLLLGGQIIKLSRNDQSRWIFTMSESHLCLCVFARFMCKMLLLSLAS